ncbi:hypothetical protein JCM8547_004971 [Rhodosporidiobolus lusitaniae]
MAKNKAVAAPAAPSSNWKALLGSIKPSSSAPDSPNNSRKRKRKHSSVGTDASAGLERPSKGVTGTGKGKERAVEQEEGEGRSGKKGKGERKMVPVDEIMQGGSGASYQQDPGQYLAIDCEMVGVGPEGVESTLARVSIVNFHGYTVLDRFVRPREKVTDYRTWVSGVREEDLRNAPTLMEVQKEVANLITGKILVGHALSNDTTVLLLSHPRHMTRDTSKYAPLQGLAKTKRPGLKNLAKLVLGVDIQAGEHSSVIDARATMAIYRSQKSAWEDSFLKHTTPTLLTTTTPALQDLDVSRVNLTGVGKKKQHLGLAATLRHVRAEREAEAAEGEDEEKDELVELEKRKKRRTETGEDLVLGFDFEATSTVVEPAVPRGGGGGGGKGGKAGGGGKATVKVKEKKVKVAGRAFKGDREKRPESKEGWWDED